MYAAHKAAGGITSVSRQIGIGCEELFRQILQNQLQLDDEQIGWSYTIKTDTRSERKLTLDARIITTSISNSDKQERFATWLREAAQKLDYNILYRICVTGSCV